MITSWQLYWITRLDSVVNCFSFVAGASCLGIFVCLFFGMMARLYDETEASNKMFKGAFYLIFLLFPSAIISVFTPSTKEMAAILLIPKIQQSIVANKKLTEMPDKLLDLANVWIEDLKPGKKSGN